MKANTSLVGLDCSDNQLTALDVTANTALEYLDCEYNQLSDVDVKANTSLVGLDCSGNQLTTLDVSANTALEYLDCSDNELTGLYVGLNRNLEQLYCCRNSITDKAVLKVLTDRFGTDPDVVLPQRGVVYWNRLAGLNRYDTAARIADQGFTTSQNVILVRGDDFPDALSASSLAGALGCPIVTTDSKVLSPEAFSEIQALRARQVYVIGGKDSVSQSEIDTLEAAGISVARIAGNSRVGTAVLVAAEARSIQAKSSQTPSDTCIITKGWAYADALAMSPYAYTSKSPVFLANKDGSLPVETVIAIAMGGYSKAIVLGGVDGVSDESMAILGKTTSVKSWIRLAGSDRYATAELIAEWATGATDYAIQPTEDAKLSYDRMAVARGDDFPDALASVDMLGPSKSALLLVKSDATDKTTHDRIDRVIGGNKDTITYGYILGGPKSVNTTIEEWMNEATE